MQVWSDDGIVEQTGSRTLAFTSGGENDLYFLYSDFSGSIDWNNVSALQVTMHATANRNEYIGGPGIELTNTPEPGTFALMGVLLSMGGAACRRMKAGQKTDEQKV